MTPDTAARAVSASSLAELTWIEADGTPQTCGVVALLWRGSPAVAFTYAAAARAERVAAASRAVLTITEPRGGHRGFLPAAITGRPRLDRDLDGTVFADELLEQELRRYPPARTYADSLMLIREHWWYLPRLILRLDVDSVRTLPPRQRAEDRMLAVATGHGPVVHTIGLIGLAGDTGRTIPMESLDGDPLPSGPAVLFGQDASFPDLEQWTTWAARGRSHGDRIELGEDLPRGGLDPVPSVWQRLRRERQFARACREGIRTAERGHL